jgi:hypothetical protein
MHRILPGHLGGTYAADNIELLTVEQHAEAHRLLWENFGCQEDFIAWQGLSGQIGKEEIIRAVLHLAAVKGGRAGKGVTRNNGNKRPDLAARNLLGITKGVPKSEEHRRKISQSMMGHIVSESTREKISAARKERS